jgi:hypothetical protein
MHSDAPYFSILLCLTPDDFTCQVESAATQWVIKLQQNTISLYITSDHPQQLFSSFFNILVC